MSTQSATQFITVPSQPNNPDDKEQLQLAYCILTPTDESKAQKRPALLVRGWQGVKEDWQYVATGLARDRPVVIFDNRSIGESTIPKTQYTIHEFVNDVKIIVTEVVMKQFSKYDKIHLFGQSMGGAIVQEFLLQYGNLVQSAIIGCSLVNGVTAAKSDDFIQFAAKSPPATPEGLKQYQLEFLHFLYTAELINDPVNQQFLQKIGQIRNAYKRDPVGARQQGNALASHKADDKLQKINVPVLIQHGTDDRMLLYSNGELLHKLIPNSELSTYEKCGHMYWANDWAKGDDARLPSEMRDWFNKYETTQ